MSSIFNMCHIFIGSTFMFYVLGFTSMFYILRFFRSFSCKLVGRHLGWNTFNWNVFKTLWQHLTCPGPGYMPPYCPEWKFDFDDNTIIISKTTSWRINSLLHDIRVGSINGKMSRNPPRNKKTKSSVQKWPLVEDMKSRFIQKRSQVSILRK